MADTSFGINDPRTQKVWSKQLFNDAFSLMRMGPLVGTDEFAPIRHNRDLETNQGGSVIFEADDELDDAGVGDDGDTSSAAQALTSKNQVVFVHSHATRTKSKGAYSMQLTSMTTPIFRTKSRAKLANWIAKKQDGNILGSLTGEYNENYTSGDIEIINEVYPSDARILRLGQTIDSTPDLDNSEVSYATDALLSAATRTNNLFGTLVIDKARLMAVKASPRMRPCRVYKQNAKAERSPFYPVQGQLISDNMYLIFVSPEQVAHLRHGLGEAAWAITEQRASHLGELNPIFTGATSIWNGCVVYEWERIPTRTGAGGTTMAEGFLLNADRTATTDAVANLMTLARGFLLGANAGLFATAKAFNWFEDYEDGKPFVRTEGLYGCKVSQWNAHGGSTPGLETARICIETFI